MKQMGGSIAVSSPGAGRGTTFTMLFEPAAEQAAGRT
jgi:hypothetical protein